MKKKLFLYMLLIVVLIGCQENNKSSNIPDYRIQEDIDASCKNIAENTEDIETNTKKIETEAVTIKKKARGIEDISDDTDIAALTGNIKDSSDKILDSTDNLRIVKNDLLLTQSKLSIAKNKIDEISDNSKRLKKERDAAIRERDELKEDLQSYMGKILKIVIISCTIGVGIFGGLIFFGNVKTGLFGATSCGITLVLATAIGQHIVLIGWIGAGILLFAIGIAGWHMYQERKTIKEIITTTETVKNSITAKERNALFGNKNIGSVKGIQSSRTEKIVDRVIRKNPVRTIKSTTANTPIKKSVKKTKKTKTTKPKE